MGWMCVFFLFNWIPYGILTGRSLRAFNFISLPRPHEHWFCLYVCLCDRSFSLSLSRSFNSLVICLNYYLKNTNTHTETSIRLLCFHKIMISTHAHNNTLSFQRLRMYAGPFVIDGQHYTIHSVIIYCVDLFKNSRISSDFNLNK